MVVLGEEAVSYERGTPALSRAASHERGTPVPLDVDLSVLQGYLPDKKTHPPTTLQ